MYQSEQDLEQKLIEKLKRQGYTYVEIQDYDALVDNFKTQIENFFISYPISLNILLAFIFLFLFSIYTFTLPK